MVGCCRSVQWGPSTRTPPPNNGWPLPLQYSLSWQEHSRTSGCEGDLETAQGSVALAAQKIWDLGNSSPSSHTFNAFLEPLAASFIRPSPQSLLSTLLLHLLTLLTLVGGQTLISRRSLHRDNVLPKGEQKLPETTYQCAAAAGSTPKQVFPGLVTSKGRRYFEDTQVNL